MNWERGYYSTVLSRSYILINWLINVQVLPDFTRIFRDKTIKNPDFLTSIMTIVEKINNLGE